MVDRANARLGGANLPPDERVSFDIGDVRTVRFDQKFDAVAALFHVMSYQVTDSDLTETIRTASSHLAVGGVFLFDCWYGPAVADVPPGSARQAVREFAASGVSRGRAADAPRSERR